MHVHNKQLLYDLLPCNSKDVPPQLFLPKNNGFWALLLSQQLLKLVAPN